MAERDPRDVVGRTVDFLISEEFQVDESLTSHSYADGKVFVVEGSEIYRDSETNQEITVVGVVDIGHSLTSLKLRLVDALRKSGSLCYPLEHSVRIGDLPLNGRQGMPRGDVIEITCTTGINT